MSPAEAGRLLGVSPPDLDGCRSMTDAEVRLKAWKDGVVQAAWRREVRLVHPDRAEGDEDRLRRTRATQRVNAAREVLLAVRVALRRPPPTRVVVRMSGAGFGATTGSTTATTAGWPWSF